MFNAHKGDFRCMDVILMMKEKDGSLQSQENWTVVVNMVREGFKNKKK